MSCRVPARSRRRGRSPRAAAGTEHDGALRHLARSAATQAEPVGEVAAQRAVAGKLSVLTAPASRASSPSSSHSATAAALCGSVTLAPSTPSAAQTAHGRAELGGRHAQRHVDAVEPERRGGRVLHARRARVLDRVADHAGDARRARDRHAGCVCWKCWKSAKVREKWWRRFGSPGIAT